MEYYLKTFLAVFCASSFFWYGTECLSVDCRTSAVENQNGTETDVLLHYSELRDMVYVYAPEDVRVPYVFSTEAIILWDPPENINFTDIIFNDTVVNATLEMEVNKNGSLHAPASKEINYEIKNLTDFQPEASNETLSHTPMGEPMDIPDDWNKTDKLLVRKPCHQLLTYLVFYYETNTPELYKELRVPNNVTELRLVRITPGTNYTVTVLAEYPGEQRLESDSVQFLTMGYGKDKKCECSKHGRHPLFPECNPEGVNWCKCRVGYTGLFCEFCKPGYYRVAPNFPCHRCPCHVLHSSGVCQFADNSVRCSRCHPGYSGNLCHRCVYGYFAVNGRCQRCHCHGNNDPRQPYMCSPATGQCIGCMFNTTGHMCDRCAAGYTGDALIARNCTLIADVEAKKSKAKAGVGIIATVCVIIILSLSALAGLIVYRKWNHLPSMRSFWTVELRDHESVSFSGLADSDHFSTQAKNFDDMAFYEKQKKKGKEQSYAPLREDI